MPEAALDDPTMVAAVMSTAFLRLAKAFADQCPAIAIESLITLSEIAERNANERGLSTNDRNFIKLTIERCADMVEYQSGAQR